MEKCRNRINCSVMYNFLVEYYCSILRMHMRIRVQKLNYNIYRRYDNNIALELARLIRFDHSGRQCRTRVQTVLFEIYISDLITVNHSYIIVRLHNTIHNII